MSLQRVRAHGITLDIDVPVPGWRAAAPTSTDRWTVSVALDSPAMTLGPQPEPGRVTWKWSDDTWPHRYSLDLHGGLAPGSTRYVVDRSAHRIDVETAGAVTLNGCLEILGKWILADLARHDHGALPLHATAVGAPSGAVLLTGDSGRGKSSLTTAMCTAGAVLIADEPACVVPAATRSTLLPGIGLLRLDPEAARRLGIEAAERWVDVSGGGDDAGKLLLVDTAFDGPAAEPDPTVSAIIVLGPRRAVGSPVSVERLTPRAAFHALFEQRYTRALEERSIRRDFSALAVLADSVPILRAELIDDLAELPGAAHRLLDEIADLSS